METGLTALETLSAQYEVIYHSDNFRILKNDYNMVAERLGEHRDKLGATSIVWIECGYSHADHYLMEELVRLGKILDKNNIHY